MRSIAFLSFCFITAATASALADDPVQRGTARGRIEFSTAAPLVIPPEDPKLKFELVEWIEIQRPQPPQEVRSDKVSSIKWHEAWLQTEEGKQWRADAVRRHEAALKIPFELKHDNTFEVANVPFGRYTVRVRADDPEVRARLKAGSHYIDVGAAPTAEGPVKRPSTTVTWTWGKGDLAPDVRLEFFDGQSKKLSDFRGKTVVLHFWGTWCAPCVAELPQWKKLRDDVAGNENIAIIDISCDDAERAKAFMKKHGYDWPLASNGGVVDDGPVTGPFGITGYPSVAVVDPEGKVVTVGPGTVPLVRNLVLNEPFPKPGK